MSKSAARVEKSEDGLTIIYSHDQIPKFRSEAEEHEFWKTHTWSDELMDQAEADPDLPLLRSKTRSSITSIRFEDDTLRRLKALAAKKGMSYQALLKTFVAERLYEEEKREGIIR
jgi:predicted DNA binding CopG/RHH family protein